MTKRLVALALVVLSIVVVASTSAGDDVRTAAVFAESSRPGTPRSAVGDDVVSVTWFCGGTAALGAADNGEYGGDVIATNPGETPAVGTVTILTIDRDPVVVPFSIEPRSQSTIDLDQVVTANYVSAVVEVDRVDVTVEQRSLHPAGDVLSPCANTTAAEWYVADGFTASDSDLRLLMSNPYLSPAIVDITISTAQGPRSPSELQGYVIPPRSLRVLNLEEAGFRDEPVVAASVVATSGRIVVAKDQHFLGSGRLGHVTSLGAPALGDEWWFADGEKGEGVTERLVIFNPTDTDVEADVIVLGLDASAGVIEPTTLTVPSREVVVFDTSAIAGLPDGRHGLLVSTLSEPALVVERVLTRPTGESVSTSVLLGAEGDALSTRWLASVTPTIALEGALVVLNVSPNDASVDVLSVGPGGEDPIPQLSDLTIPANGWRSIDLVDAVSLGRPIVVRSDQPILVERRIERNERGSGTSAALAFPDPS